MIGDSRIIFESLREWKVIKMESKKNGAEIVLLYKLREENQYSVEDQCKARDLLLTFH